MKPRKIKWFLFILGNFCLFQFKPNFFERNAAENTAYTCDTCVCVLFLVRELSKYK